MDKNERLDWHYRQNIRLNRIAAEMGKLFTLGYDAEQTEEYKAKQEEYLQGMTDAQYPDDPPGTHSHFTHG